MNFNCHSCGFSKNISSKYAGKKVRCPKCNELVKCNEVVGKNKFEEIQIKKASGTQRVSEKKTPSDNIPSLKSFIKRYVEKSDYTRLEGLQIVELYLHDGVKFFSGEIIESEGEIKKESDNLLRGRGKIKIAQRGQKISQIKLDNDSIYVNSLALIACESKLIVEKKEFKSSNEKFFYKISGKGIVIICSFGSPKVISNDGTTVSNAKFESTLMWTAGLKYTLGGKMTFQGEGYVFTQPYNSKEKAFANLLKNNTSVPSSNEKKLKITSIVACLGLAIMSFMYINKPQVIHKDRALASEQTPQEILAERISRKKFELKNLKIKLKRMGTKATEDDRDKIKLVEKEIFELEKKL